MGHWAKYAQQATFLYLAIKTLASPDLDDCIAAIATPPGAGALGVIRLSGKGAFRIGGSLFRGASLSEARSHTIHVGTLHDVDGRLLDEVVALVFRGPQSYTGEDVLEFSCHGSPYVLEQVLQGLLRQGARLARPGEFTLRAYLNGRIDLSQAEAVGDLIAATTAGEHRFALQQLRGGISREMGVLRQKLLDFASLIELELDFGEEDVAFADRSELIRLVDHIADRLQPLLESFSWGNAVKEGVHTVIAGRPNAGKSTLLNALLDESRAIVSEMAGTTRDTIESNLVIGGIRFRLVDTAGIRSDPDGLEALGIERTRAELTRARLVLYVFDVAVTRAEEVLADVEGWLGSGCKVLLVANKMDLHPYATFDQFFAKGVGGLLADQWVPVSARNDMNVSFLKERLRDFVLADAQHPDATVVTNARHYEALLRVMESMDAVREGLASGISGDFLAMDIRRAIHWLGEITGKMGVEDLLGHIFSKFCIGK